MLFLGTYRTKGRAANTIHGICRTLALLCRHVGRVQEQDGGDIASADELPPVDGATYLRDRFRSGRFLIHTELVRLAEVARYRMDSLEDEDDEQAPARKVVNISSLDCCLLGSARSTSDSRCWARYAQTPRRSRSAISYRSEVSLTGPR